MRRRSVALVSAVFCMFSLGAFAQEKNFRSLEHLSHPSLEQLASGFDLILRNDVTAPFNGEWGYVSRTQVLPMRNISELVIEHVAFLELCAKLGSCPDSIDITLNTRNDVEALVNVAGVFLFQQSNEEYDTSTTLYTSMLRERTLNKLRHLVSKALQDQSLITYLGVQHSPSREGSFAAFYDSKRKELLIIGSNTRP